MLARLELAHCHNAGSGLLGEFVMLATIKEAGRIEI